MRSKPNPVLFVALLSLFAVVAANGCGNLDGAPAGGDIETTTSSVTDPNGTNYYEKSFQCTASGPAGTQTMLCCPPGKAMVGYYPATVVSWPSVVNPETLKCKDFMIDGVDSSLHLDTGTQRTIWQDAPATGHTPMHVCPYGFVMVGIHASTEAYACQKVKPYHNTAERLDLNTADTGTAPWLPNVHMHVCPGARALSGIQRAKNQLSCYDDDVQF